MVMAENNLSLRSSREVTMLRTVRHHRSLLIVICRQQHRWLLH